MIDLALGLGVIIVATLASATIQSGGAQVFLFLIAAAASVAVLYASLLIFAALVFWSPGLLFTWVFDAIMQLARYPIGIYPGWLQFVLTWIIPVAIMTTIPASALTGDIQPLILLSGVALAAILFVVASVLFHSGVKRYNSASS